MRGSRWMPWVLSVGVIAGSLFIARTSGAFPGVNGKIVFTSFRDNNPRIYTMNADGSGQTNVTLVAPHDSFSPAWSPDGTRTPRFGRSRHGPYVMDGDGTNPVQVTQEGLRGSTITPRGHRTERRSPSARTRPATSRSSR